MQLPKSTTHRVLYGLSGLIVLYGFALPIVAGTMSIFTDWDGEPSVLGRLYLFGVPILSTIILVVGLAVQTKNPRRGLHLIIPGAIGPAIWYWMLPLYAPLMIAVIALAVAVTPRKRTRVAHT